MEGLESSDVAAITSDVPYQARGSGRRIFSWTRWAVEGLQSSRRLCGSCKPPRVSAVKESRTSGYWMEQGKDNVKVPEGLHQW